jgi:predicted hydrocarbon binding protein
LKGIILKQFEDMVVEQLGIAAWDSVLETTALSEPSANFLAARTYPDSDLFALVASVSKRAARSPEQLLHSFGRFLFPRLAQLYPMFLASVTTAKPFLLSIDRVIHVQIRQQDGESSLPVIAYEDPSPEALVLLYRSPRNLCDLAIGLIEGVGRHFGEAITVAQTACRKHGADECRLECTFAT